MDSFLSLEDAPSNSPRSILTEEAVVEPMSPGAWHDVEELVQENLPPLVAPPKEESSRQLKQHKKLLEGVGLNSEDLVGIYGLETMDWEEYKKKLTADQIDVERKIRAGYKNKKTSEASRERWGKELQERRNLLEALKLQAKEKTSKSRQLAAELQWWSSQLEELEATIRNHDLEELTPVKEGSCTLMELVEWFPQPKN